MFAPVSDIELKARDFSLKILQQNLHQNSSFTEAAIFGSKTLVPRCITPLMPLILSLPNIWLRVQPISLLRLRLLHRVSRPCKQQLSSPSLAGALQVLSFSNRRFDCLTIHSTTWRSETPRLEDRTGGAAGAEAEAAAESGRPRFVQNISV